MSWNLRHEGFLEYGESKTFQYEYLSETKNCFEAIKLSENLSQIPINNWNSKRSIPEWRSSICFDFGPSSSAFLGEIPTMKSKASFFANPLLANPLKATKTKICLLNFQENPEVREHQLHHLDHSNLLLNCFTIYSNCVNWISVEKLSLDDKLVCKSIGLLPIFVNQFPDGSISVEHTHPPALSVATPNRFNYGRMLVKYLVSKNILN